MKKWLLEIFPLSIVLLSFLVIQWRNIESVPYGIEGDEKCWTISSLANKYGIDATNFNVFVGHRVDQYNFPVSVAINKASFQFFGKNFVAPRKMLLLLNLSTLIFFYLICRGYLSKYVSLITTTLYAFSTFNLITSRIAIIGSYTRIFFLPAIYLAIIASKTTSFKKAVVITVLCGISILLALLTYNTAYILVPVIVFYLFASFSKNFSPYKTFLLILLLLLPILIYLPKIIVSFQQQSFKGYVFKDAVSLGDSPRVMINKAVASVANVKGEFFGKFTPDMLANWPNSLFNINISCLCAIGLTLVIIRTTQSNKYLFLMIWSLLYLIGFNCLLGFNYPRMWITTSSLVYILAGVAIGEAMMFISKYTTRTILFLFFILTSFFTFFIAKTDYSTYQQHATKNASFTAPIMEEARNLSSILTDPKNKITLNNFLLLEENQALADNSLPILLFSYLSLQTEAKKSLPKETEILNLLTNNISTFEFLPEKNLKEIQESKNKSVIILPLRLSTKFESIFREATLIKEIKEEKYYKIIYL